MKILLDYDKCIGCGLCFMLNNHVFSLDDDGYCKLKKKEVTKGELPTVKKVIKSCPTKAVSIEEKEVKN